VPPIDYSKVNVHEQDAYDLDQLYNILEKEILPMYYDQPDTWRQVVKNGMRDIRYQFDSNRMADEYYNLLYNVD
jgi:starch phosphorylase